MPAPARAIVIALLPMLAVPANAFDFNMPWVDREASFEITETMVLDYHDENHDGDPRGNDNDDYYDIRNRLNLKLSVDDFSLAARLDAAFFFDAPEDALPPYLNQLRPEKLNAAYRGKHLQVDLGDFYTSFGRGIALRIRKTDELSEDTTLLGGKIRTQLGPLEITGLAGLSNPTNTDSIEEKTLEDPYDLITGLRTSGRIADTLVLGIHGVGLIIDPLENNQAAQDMIEMSTLYDSALVAGATVEVPDLSDKANLYAEFDWMQKSLKIEDLPEEDGWAAYFGGNLFLGNWTVSAEFKSYHDYRLYTVTDQRGDGQDKYKSMQLDYIRPPTLEPEDMEVQNNHNVTGARLRADWRPGGADTLLFASYAGFLASESGADDDTWIYNLRLGAEQYFLKRGRAKFDVGLREEVPDWTGGIHHHLLYINADLRLPLGTRHSLNLHGNNWLAHRFQGKLYGSEAYVIDYLKGEWTLGYSWSPLLTVDIIVGYDTEASESRNLEVFFEGRRQVFLAGSLTVNLSSRVVIKLLAGQMRGGPKCVSGACRVFPPFAGVRLETVIRL
jgi:hypothetical protein